VRIRPVLLASVLLASAVDGAPDDGKPEAAAIESVWRRLPGAVAVRAMAGNGGRPVAIFLPRKLDPSRPVATLTFFHGHGWDVGPRVEADGVLSRVGALAGEDAQTVFVFPQGGPHPFGYWMAPPESFRDTSREALELAGILAGRRLTVTRRLVDAHSGGGLAVRNAAATGELDADKVNLIDAAYGAWAQVITAWALDRPGTRIESWFTCHSSVPANNAEIARLAPRIVTVHESAERHDDLPRLVLGAR